jgi:hypothetical protein
MKLFHMDIGGICIVVDTIGVSDCRSQLADIVLGERGAMPVVLYRDHDGQWFSVTAGSGSPVTMIALDCPAYAGHDVAVEAYVRPSTGRLSNCANAVIASARQSPSRTSASVSSVIELAQAFSLVASSMGSFPFGRASQLPNVEQLREWFYLARAGDVFERLQDFLTNARVVRPLALNPDRCLPDGNFGDVLVCAQSHFAVDPLGACAEAKPLTIDSLSSIPALGEALLHTEVS